LHGVHIGYRINGRSVRREGGDTRAAAEDALAIALADIARGRLRGPATRDLATYVMRWLERRVALVEPGTLAGYRNDILHRIIPTLGRVRLRDLTAEKIEAAVAEMREMTPRRGSPNPTYSAKTINKTLTTLAAEPQGDSSTSAPPRVAPVNIVRTRTWNCAR
jgi:integrase-like protein